MGPTVTQGVEESRSSVSAETQLEWISLGSITWSAGFAQIACDKRLQVALGLDGPQMTREQWLERVHPDDREGCREAREKVVAEGSHSCRYRLKLADGAWRWVGETARTLPSGGDAGNSEQVVAILQDVDGMIRDMEVRGELFDSTPAMMHAAAPDGRLLAVSDEWCRRLGFAAREILGRRNLSILTEESQVRAREEWIPRLWSEGRCTAVPLQVRTKSGEVFDVLLSAVAEYDDAGAPSRSVAVMQDVTPQRRLSDQLERQNEELQQILDAMPAMIWFKDTHNGIIRANAPAAASVGLDVEQIKGTRTEDHCPEHAAREFADDLAVIRGGTARLGIDDVIMDDAGEEVRMRTDKIPLRGESGEIERLLVVSQDVSEAHRMQKALFESDERLQLAIDAATVGTWDWDIASCRLTWDENMFSIYGIEASEFSNDYGGFARRIHPDDVERVAREVLDAVECEQGDFGITFRIVRPGGAVRHIFSRAKVHRVDGVVPWRMIGVNVDVTALKQAEAAARAHAAELERSNEELEAFARVASHDLQEPLRKVAGFCELLRKSYHGQLSDDADRWIDYAVSGAQRMQTLIKDLLGHSRVGRSGRRPDLVPLNEVFDEIVRDLVSDDAADVDLDRGELPSVIGDRLELGILLRNLVGNALKYRRPESVRVRVAARGGPEGWELSVEDDGIGITEDQAERVFEMFRRLHGPKEYSGSGIGLATCHKIVTGLGGRIWCEPGEPHGTVFHVQVQRDGDDAG